MTTTNEQSLKPSTNEVSTPPVEAQDPLAVLAAKLAEMEAKLAAATAPVTKAAAKKGMRNDDHVVANRAKVVQMAKKLGLRLEDTKGWTKIMNVDEKVLRPRISVSRNGETIYFVGYTPEGSTPISKAAAQNAHIGYARGEIDLDNAKVFEVLKTAMDIVKKASATNEVE
jgi:hypothetical protein